MRSRAALVALSAAVGGWIGWALHRPPPAPKLELRQAVQLHQLELGKFAFDRREGPTRTIDRWRAPAAPGCPAVERERIVDRGPVEVAKRAETASSATLAQTTAVVLTPPPPAPPRASWAISGGLQILPDHQLELGLEHRLLGPVWARVWLLQPAELRPPALGLGVRIEL